MKTTKSEHVAYINCFELSIQKQKQKQNNLFSEFVVFMYWTRDSMNNFLSYFGLVDARISASDKYLPVHGWSIKE